MGPGFHEIDAETYHSQELLSGPALSYSIAKLIVNKSPRHAHYAHPLLGGGEKSCSDDMDFGTIAHTLILGKGDSFAIGEFDDWRTKGARLFRDEAREAGLTPVLACRMERIGNLADAFKRQVIQSDARAFYHPRGATEVAAIWGAGDAGDPLCQSLFDRAVFERGDIYDVKTTESARPQDLVRKVINMGYDIQAEFYRLGLETLMPELAGRTKFTFLFVETEPPYAVTPITLSGEFQAIARSKVQRALRIWDECMLTDTWPTYTDCTISLDPPPWALAEEIEAEI